MAKNTVDRFGSFPSAKASSGDLPGGLEQRPAGTQKVNLSKAATQMKLLSRLTGRGMMPQPQAWVTTGQSMQRAAERQEQKIPLPVWIKAGANLIYISQSTRAKMEVVVEKISTTAREVRILFNDGKTWKSIPFSVILSNHCPLFPRGGYGRPAGPEMGPAMRPGSDATPQKKSGTDEEEGFSAEKSAARSRSRSPRK